MEEEEKMRPKVKPKFDSRAARIAQESRRKSKLAMMGVSWKTRKHGTKKQIGKKFPIESGAKLPVASRPKVTTAYPKGRAFSTKKLAKKEADKMTKAGFDGFTLVVRMKNGELKTIPVAAKNWDDFLSKIKTRLKGVDTKKIAEISLVGGGKFSLAGVGRWLGKSARIAGMYLKRAEKVAGDVGTGIERFSERMGEIAAFPKRVQEAYSRGYGGEPKPEKKEPKKAWKERTAKDIRETAEKIASRKPEKQPEPEKAPDVRAQTRRKLLVRGEYELPFAMSPAERKTIVDARKKVLELKNLRKKLEIYEKARAAPYSLVERISKLEEEIKAAGGKVKPKKKWIQKLKLREGAFRAAVRAKYGARGFTKRGTIKIAILKRLAKEPGLTGKRARLAIAFSKMRRRKKAGGKIHDRGIRDYERVRPYAKDAKRKYGGMELERHRFTSDAQNGIRIPQFKAKALWSSAGRRKRE
jgi:hypothetical protein